MNRFRTYLLANVSRAAARRLRKVIRQRGGIVTVRLPRAVATLAIDRLGVSGRYKDAGATPEIADVYHEKMSARWLGARGNHE